MEETLEQVRLFLIENHNGDTAARDSLCSWLFQRQVQVSRGDWQMWMDSPVARDSQAVMIQEGCLAEDIDVVVNGLRDQTDAMLIFLSHSSETTAIGDALAKGFDEVLTPTMSLAEQGERVMSKIRQGLRLSRQHLSYLELYERYELVVKQNEELELLSKSDALTGLFGRRYMMRKLQEEAARTQRSRHMFTMLICSLDRFDIIEESEGKEVCDRILKETAGVVTNSCRTYDIVARWSESQFMLLLPETDLTWALVVAERCRRNVKRYLFENEEKKIDLSVTIGLAEFQQNEGVGGCIRRSEHALKEATQRGSNCIVFCSAAGSELSYDTYVPVEEEQES